ncbi:putative L,D-transpeptidase YkuD [Variibacter gotjawalensis]|uniref:Putative L,D-transpeptidase YkuD n=1 Tax=Variibacter gotjawalensis TaxID=1333996 RepID=A0A0S3PRI8_9BRAD|nr:L,D-transpeptidase family protein [Variibacter gotjawalensis]NIK48877.1 lipoprotein-anchoring transpeptidase ErfK/SrfK [Variibacter gotjawalensis]RZS50734.1 lipoprotein-anchoring transpeptidase ErfK/SrfK [Variibacter gotjawalensis]BAT58570.1 putative L,D-transpeptidase YkuD [Variibacter gotjawalensis]
MTKTTRLEIWHFSIAVLLFAFSPATAFALSADEINKAQFAPQPEKKAVRKDAEPDPVIIKVQVILDRLRVSPGVIDGYDGENFRKALAELRRLKGLPEADGLDEAVWAAIRADEIQDIIAMYDVSKKDEAYKFAATPRDYGKLAKLKRISFRSPAEMIGERFHMDEKLVQLLNPKMKRLRGGDRLIVANVGLPDPESKTTQTRKKQKAPEGLTAPQAAKIVVSISLGRVSAIDEGGKLLASYPATVGSDDTPTPPGSYSVRRVVKNPTYSYDPDKNFKQGKNARKLTLPAGPNGPVGTVWIALSKPTFGIHGTPEPSKVSKTESHGCVRLTNWDAEHLASISKPGSSVEFVE